MGRGGSQDNCINLHQRIKLTHGSFCKILFKRYSPITARHVDKKVFSNLSYAFHAEEHRSRFLCFLIAHLAAAPADLKIDNEFVELPAFSAACSAAR